MIDNNHSGHVMSQSTSNYFAVVPASGIGQRFEHSTPKQFLSVHGRTIVEYALLPLLEHPDIELVVVVMQLPCVYWSTLSIANHPKIRLTQGGETRADSVFSGILELDSVANDQDWVLVHDAARPCLTSHLIQRLIKTVDDHPVGGLLATPVRDTLKRSDEQGINVVETVSREGLWQAQTPQLFRHGLLKAALLSALEDDAPITDEAQAIERQGHTPLLVEGAMSNIKLTHPEDFAWVSQWLSQEELQ